MSSCYTVTVALVACLVTQASSQQQPQFGSVNGNTVGALGLPQLAQLSV